LLDLCEAWREEVTSGGSELGDVGRVEDEKVDEKSGLQPTSVA
jgi:hypothetical protein